MDTQTKHTEFRIMYVHLITTPELKNICILNSDAKKLD